MRVAVLRGGMSAEREVSLRSGKAMADAARRLGHDVVEIDPDKTIAEQVMASRSEVALIALHGRYGEDGKTQGILDILDIPYSGSGVLASAAAMDKIFSKKIFRASGLPTPDFIAIHNSVYKGWVETHGNEVYPVPFGKPFVVKPSHEGSSLGMTFVDNPEILPTAIRTALTHDTDVLIEEMVSGPELTVGILGTENPEPLPAIEIVPHSGRYDYQSKYTKGATEYLIPPRVAKDMVDRCRELALAAHRALGCYGVSRVDIMVGHEGPQILEVNTIPGMTETSLLPKAAAAAGITFDELVDRFIKGALEKRR